MIILEVRTDLRFVKNRYLYTIEEPTDGYLGKKVVVSERQTSFRIETGLLWVVSILYTGTEWMNLRTDPVCPSECGH